MSVKDSLLATPRSRPRRRADRACFDRAVVDAILDQALVCHVGLIEAGAPVVIPATPWRVGDWLYLHGAAESRLIRTIASGAEVCVSIALVESLVFARSAMRHSSDYRSVVLFGRGEAVEAAENKTRALMALIEKLSPGRAQLVRPPDSAELAQTGLVRLAIDEGAAKIRSAPPATSDKDEGWTAWSGTVPLGLTAGAPRPVEDGGPALPPVLPSWLR